MSSDKYVVLHVILDREVHEEAVERLVDAIGTLRCVAKVERGEPCDWTNYEVAKEHARRRLQEELRGILWKP